MTLFFYETAEHVLNLLIFKIQAVAIFQTICRPVAIQAVTYFGLKVATAQHNTFGIFFLHLQPILLSAQHVMSKRHFAIEQFFEQMNWRLLGCSTRFCSTIQN